MKLITRDTDYAVRSLCFIACGKKKVVSVSDLVEALGIPRPFLRKILQALNKAGILKSYKGKGGGFSLALSADKIFLSKLMEIFQGPLKLNECIFKKNICPNRRRCILKEKIGIIEKEVIFKLRFITIADLLETKGSAK